MINQMQVRCTTGKKHVDWGSHTMISRHGQAQSGHGENLCFDANKLRDQLAHGPSRANVQEVLPFKKGAHLNPAIPAKHS